MISKRTVFRGAVDFGFRVIVDPNDTGVWLTSPKGEPEAILLPVTGSWFNDEVTASGVYNAKTDLCVSLPMSGASEPRTEGSPIPLLPWGMQVDVWQPSSAGPAIPYKGVVGKYALGDDGPAKGLNRPRAIDLSFPCLVDLSLDPGQGLYDLCVYIHDAAAAVIALAVSRGWEDAGESNA